MFSILPIPAVLEDLAHPNEMQKRLSKKENRLYVVESMIHVCKQIHKLNWILVFDKSIANKIRSRKNPSSGIETLREIESHSPTHVCSWGLSLNLFSFGACSNPCHVSDGRLRVDAWITSNAVFAISRLQSSVNRIFLRLCFPSCGPEKFIKEANIIISCWSNEGLWA